MAGCYPGDPEASENSGPWKERRPDATKGADPCRTSPLPCRAVHHATHGVRAQLSGAVAASDTSVGPCPLSVVSADGALSLMPAPPRFEKAMATSSTTSAAAAMTYAAGSGVVLIDSTLPAESTLMSDRLMIAGRISSDTRFITLMSGLSAGPAVSLNGSPTVSPITAAMWASEPLPPWLPSSMYFLALSQAPPAFDR